MENKIEELKIEDLHPYPGNPFGIRGDEEMKQLHESISESGILNPIIVRPFGSGYQILSGHRRYEAAISLGLETVPAIIRNVTDEEAVILLVDSNLHRQELLPSEKAFAYKMKLDVMKHQEPSNYSRVESIRYTVVWVPSLLWKMVPRTVTSRKVLRSLFPKVLKDV